MVAMEALAANGISFPVLIAYGLLISLYLLILKLLLDLMQSLGNKHHLQKTVIDVDIHKTMTPDIDSSMQAFDVYSIAFVIAKWGIAAVAMAVIIVLLSLKVGIIATALLIMIVITLLWGVNIYLKSREKPDDLRVKVQRVFEKSGSIGTVILLAIALAVVIFIMIWIH
jgi:hypothetical protein